MSILTPYLQCIHNLAEIDNTREHDDLSNDFNGMKVAQALCMKAAQKTETAYDLDSPCR